MSLFYPSGLLMGIAQGQTYLRNNRTEKDVTIPPAFMITDANGATWIFGNEYVERRGQYEFNVLCNDVDVGEFAYKIVYSPTRGNRRGQVMIYGAEYGRKIWNGRTFI